MTTGYCQALPVNMNTDTTGSEYAARQCQITLPADEALHARVATRIVKPIKDLDAEVAISDGKRTVNGQSILSLMLLGAQPGTTLTVRAHGRDADRALKRIREAVAV